MSDVACKAHLAKSCGSGTSTQKFEEGQKFLWYGGRRDCGGRRRVRVQLEMDSLKNRLIEEFTQLRQEVRELPNNQSDGQQSLATLT